MIKGVNMEENKNYESFTEDAKIEEKDALHKLNIVCIIMFPIIIISFVANFFIMTKIIYDNNSVSFCIGIGLVIYFIWFLEICIYFGLAKPYKQKLKDAQINDKVRKYARIWYKEFKRLELEDKKKQIKLPPKKEL